MAAFSLIRFLPAFALGFFCLELASIILVGQRLGVLTTVLLIILDIVLGMSVIRTAGANAFSQIGTPLRSPAFEARLAGGMALRVMSGLLFIIPGFFSDMLALLLLTPPVRGWLSRRFKPVSQASATYTRKQAGPVTIIEGEAVEISGEIEEPPFRDTGRRNGS